MKTADDPHDWNSDEVKALGPEGRGKLIVDSVAPRNYSWMTNPDGLKYLHEHAIGESPPGSFTVAGPSRAYNGPIADDSD
jgi:hypothetical protein